MCDWIPNTGSAQAVVAGLLDVFASPARVESGRINDPSQKYLGDVFVRSEADAEAWDKAFEVRDKPVAVSDVEIFGKKCVDMQVHEAAVMMANDRQPALDDAARANDTLLQGKKSLRGRA